MMGRESDPNEDLHSKPKSARQEVFQAGRALPGSPKEIVAGISHEFAELREKLRRSPAVHANRNTASLLEAMSKFSLPRRSPSECFSPAPSDRSTSLSLRELHTGLSRGERPLEAGNLDQPIGQGLNANFREAGKGPKTSKVFNSNSLPGVPPAASSESSVSMQESSVSSGSSPRSDQQARKKLIRAKTMREGSGQAGRRIPNGVKTGIRKGVAVEHGISTPSGQRKGKVREARERSRKANGEPVGHDKGISNVMPAATTGPSRHQRGVVNETAVVDSGGWLCGTCRAVDSQASPYPYTERRKGGLGHPHGVGLSRSVLGNFMRRLKSSPARLMRPPPTTTSHSGLDQQEHSCRSCSLRQADSTVAAAMEAEYRKMAQGQEERMKNMQESVQDMMRTIASQLQQLEKRASVSVDKEQMPRFCSANGDVDATWGYVPKCAESMNSAIRLVVPDQQYDDNQEILSPMDPPNLLAWQHSPTSSSKSSFGVVPSLSSVILEKVTRKTRQAIFAFTEALVEDQDPDSMSGIVKELLPRVHFVKASHAKYGLESCIAGAFFSDFDEPFYGVPPATLDGESENPGRHVSVKDCWEAYQRVAEAHPQDVINDRHPSSDKSFHCFCQAKLKLFQEEVKWISKWSTDLVNTFLEAAIGVWRLHLLALSFEPCATLIHASQYQDYSPEYMELVESDAGADGEYSGDDHVFCPSVEFTVMPGFKTLDGYIRCQVYLKVRTRRRTERHTRRQMTM